MNQTVESLQKFWRRITPWRSSIRPSTLELSHSHSHSHSHEDVQIRWSNDQISITLSLSKYFDLIFFFVLPQFACAIVTFAAPRYACLLFTRVSSRYVPSLLFLAASICVRWIVVFPSHDLLFFYSLAPSKISQKQLFSKSVRVLFPIFLRALLIAKAYGISTFFFLKKKILRHENDAVRSITTLAS